MERIIKRLLRMSENHNMPVILYDSKTDKAGVLMTLDYFEDHLDFDGSGDESLSDLVISDESEAFPESIPRPVNFLSDLQELEEKIIEKVDHADDSDMIDQTNTELALWKAKREEKEREEIEKTLEDELIENPPADPFEEDFLHTPEWHTSSTLLEPQKKVSEPIKEPSYHPVMNSGGSLSWNDWTFTGNSFTPILQKVDDLSLEEGGEDPIFLEEPV